VTDIIYIPNQRDHKRTCENLIYEKVGNVLEIGRKNA